MQDDFFTTRPAVQEDIPRIAQLASILFSDADHTRIMVPRAKQYPKEFYEWTLHRYKMRFANPDISMQVIENASKELIACTVWTAEGQSKVRDSLPPTSWGASLEQTLLKWQHSYMRYFILHCVDWKAADEIKTLTHHMFERIPTRLHLDILFVRPDYQGKGIGKSLLHQVLNIAKDAGVPVTLESTAAGKPLYDKEGFRVIGNLQFSGGEVEIPVMLWSS